MINFKDELKKYEPILELNDIEDSIRSTDMKDIMDMLDYISRESSASSFIKKRGGGNDM